jgi:mono/diheme cytochrome c family protein
MSNNSGQWAVGSGQLAARGKGRRVLYCLLLSVYCLLFLGCRQDMQDQPRYEVYESSGFFKDGLSSRPLVEGTVPRGYLRADKQLYTGKMESKAGAASAGGNSNTGNQMATQQGGQETSSGAGGETTSGSANGQAGGSSVSAQAGSGGNSNASAANGAAAAAQGKAGDTDDAVDFPFPVTAEVVARGRERFEIYCAMCHGYTGEGDGMIVRRGYRRPPSYHEDRLRQAPVGYFFRVMTEGFGAMPPYRAQVPVQDRWAIAAYIRALQLSQMNQQLAPAHATEGSGAEAGGHK